MTGQGDPKTILDESAVRGLILAGLPAAEFSGKKLLVILPDHTRTAPIPMMFRLLHEHLGGVVEKMDYLIALGTHPPMPEDRINALLGLSAEKRREQYGHINIFNHHWDDPGQLTQLGQITAEEIEQLSDGLMRESVPVVLNKMILDYDCLLVVGPTFPHEVVGFSGGNKYFFPGIAAKEIINFTHWLGATITNPEINGTKDTPVRRVIDQAASMIPIPRRCCSMVVSPKGLHGLYIGRIEETFSAAADLSAKVHVVYKDHPYRKVLGIAPAMYDDIWTAGKVMYKLEPILADGAELIIYAPHIDEISYTHGEWLDKIGYHTRDYFLKQMDRFRDVPRGIMAHSTHVKGIGTFEAGIERPRANVILATAISEARCRKVNLGYLDPGRIDPDTLRNREAEGILVVDHAGEFLHRLSDR